MQRWRRRGRASMETVALLRRGRRRPTVWRAPSSPLHHWLRTSTATPVETIADEAKELVKRAGARKTEYTRIGFRASETFFWNFSRRGSRPFPILSSPPSASTVPRRSNFFYHIYTALWRLASIGHFPSPWPVASLWLLSHNNTGWPSADDHLYQIQ